MLSYEDKIIDDIDDDINCVFENWLNIIWVYKSIGRGE